MSYRHPFLGSSRYSVSGHPAPRARTGAADARWELPLGLPPPPPRPGPQPLHPCNGPVSSRTSLAVLSPSSRCPSELSLECDGFPAGASPQLPHICLHSVCLYLCMCVVSIPHNGRPSRTGTDTSCCWVLFWGPFPVFVFPVPSPVPGLQQALNKCSLIE